VYNYTSKTNIIINYVKITDASMHAWMPIHIYATHTYVHTEIDKALKESTTSAIPQVSGISSLCRYLDAEDYILLVQY